MALYMEWNDSLNTGIRTIDEQHKKIVSYINKLHEVSAHPDQKVVRLVLEQLVDYTDIHFKFEESLMADAQYSHLVAHQKVHALFIRRILDYRSRFEAGEDVTKLLLSTLRAWLISHIKSEDADYVSVVQVTMQQKEREEGWLARQLKRFFG
ncbi:MAG TPA: bacteriohemerythrin [Candidatus Competibacteraceae bacterium]|nr:MAG: bacteriohemerythrin [Candidatus Competibacteraceae bacterium]HQA25532.1 bacteriohemerythrin [Candidatus Competibacteraceae bacterium]